MKQLILFGIVGTVGFIVDAAILIYLTHVEQIGIFSSRVISFLSAVFITWILNRYLTFSYNKQKSNKSKEYIKYLSVQTIGAGINFTVFFALLFIYEPFKDILIIPLAVASIIAMFFNYFLSKKKVFV